MNMKFQRKLSGFTLIELIIVIVILGILAVVALPKFIDLSGDANNAVNNFNNGATNEKTYSDPACKLLPSGKNCDGT